MRWLTIYVCTVCLFYHMLWILHSATTCIYCNYNYTYICFAPDATVHPHPHFLIHLSQCVPKPSAAHITRLHNYGRLLNSSVTSLSKVISKTHRATEGTEKINGHQNNYFLLLWIFVNKIMRRRKPWLNDRSSPLPPLLHKNRGVTHSFVHLSAWSFISHKHINQAICITRKE